jgi:hypothetical protein
MFRVRGDPLRYSQWHSPFTGDLCGTTQFAGGRLADSGDGLGIQIKDVFGSRRHEEAAGFLRPQLTEILWEKAV